MLMMVGSSGLLVTFHWGAVIEIGSFKPQHVTTNTHVFGGIWEIVKHKDINNIVRIVGGGYDLG